MPSAVKTSGVCFIKREFEHRSGITPYICSTWQDLQEEHALLTTHVFPELERVCRQRAVCFDPIHLLHHDNNTDLVQDGSYLTSCFNYIRRCAPFFICLLGERYGHHKEADSEQLPSDALDDGSSLDWWDKNLCMANGAGYDWVLERSTQYCSEVELQVTEAAFRQNGEYCHFYYRKPECTDTLYTDLLPTERSAKLNLLQPESDQADAKLRTLKQRVINKGHRVRYYGSLQEFCRLVLEDWMVVIDTLCPPLTECLSVTRKKDEEIYKNWLTHEHYADIRRRDFVPMVEHDEILAELTEFALTALDDPPEDWDRETGNNKLTSPADMHRSVLTVVGDRGSGKTSLLAHWVKEFTEDYGFVRVFTHYVGVDDQSLSGVAMLKRCMAYLSNELQQNMEYLSENGGTEVSLPSIGQVFTAALAHQPCVLVLDGLDDLGKSTVTPSSQVRELSWLLYPLPPHVRVIVTTCRSDTSYQKLSKRPDTRVVEMPHLSSMTSKMELLNHYLGNCHGNFRQEQLESICRSRQSEKPLFVQILAAELRHPHVLTDLNQYLETYMETCSVRELMSKLIRRWVKMYSWNINKNAVQAQGFKKQTDTVRDTSGWVAETLRLVAVSRDGLKRSELLMLLQQIGYHGSSEVTECDWLLFCDVICDSILYETPEGVLRFRHVHIREAIEHALLSPDSPQQAADYSVKVVIPKKKLDPSKERKQIEKVIYSRHIGRFFFTQPFSDRKLHELPWQLAGCKDYVRLKQSVGDPRLFHSMYTHPDYRTELLCIWAILQLAGYDPSQTYVDMLALAAHINDVPEITVSTEDRGDLSQTPDGSLCDPPEKGASDWEVNLQRDDSAGGSMMDRDLLQLSVGEFLGELMHFDTALRILSDLHTSINQRVPLPTASELVRCRLEDVMASHLLQLDMLGESSSLYERALSSVSDMLVMMMSSEEEAELVKLKGGILTKLSSVYIVQRKTKQAEEGLRHAHHCMVRSNCVLGAAQVLYNTGVLRLEQHQYDKADECFQKALDEYRKWYGPNHHKVADVLHEYAGLLCNSGNTHRYEKEAAKKMFGEALRLREQHYGASHLIVAETLCHFGNLLKSLADPSCRSEALTMLRRALDIRSTQLGPTHVLTKQVYAVMNDLEVALQYHSLPHFYSDRRPDNTLYTTLSWHEAELLQFQLKKSRRLAQKRNAKLAMAVRAIGFFKAITSSKKDVTRLLKDPSSLQSTKGSGSKSAITDTTWTYSDSQISVPAGEKDREEEEAVSYSSQGEELISERTVNHTEEGEAVNHRQGEGLREPEANHSQGKEEEPAVDPTEGEELRINEQAVNQSEIIKVVVGKVKDNNTEPPSEREPFISSRASLVSTKTHSRSSGQRVSGRPVFRVDIKHRESSEYLDSYSGVADTSEKSVRLLRPQSAPYKMLQKYRGLSVSSQVSLVVPPHTTSTKRRVTSAPSTSSPHQRVCQPPRPHAIHATHSLSVINGPQTSTESLLGTHTAHPVGLRVHHSSAWYHMPGRYSTPTQYYPPKRHQKRIGDAHKKLLKNLQARSGSRMVSDRLPTHQGARTVIRM